MWERGHLTRPICLTSKLVLWAPYPTILWVWAEMRATLCSEKIEGRSACRVRVPSLHYPHAESILYALLFYIRTAYRIVGLPNNLPFPMNLHAGATFYYAFKLSPCRGGAISKGPWLAIEF